MTLVVFCIFIAVRRKPMEDNKENMPQQDAMKREVKTIFSKKLKYMDIFFFC